MQQNNNLVLHKSTKYMYREPGNLDILFWYYKRLIITEIQDQKKEKESTA